MASKAYQRIASLPAAEIEQIWRNLGRINHELGSLILSSRERYHNLTSLQTREQIVREQVLSLLEAEEEYEREEEQEVLAEVKFVRRTTHILQEVKGIEEGVNAAIHSWKLYHEGSMREESARSALENLGNLDHLVSIEKEIRVIRREIISLKKEHGLTRGKLTRVLAQVHREARRDLHFFDVLFDAITQDLNEVERHILALKQEFRI